MLQDFSLKVKPGETIALVGPTGGGKSTIVNLLCRFYEPKQGVIRIGGQGLHRAIAAGHPVPRRHGAANAASVFRNHPRKYPLRASGRDGRRGGTGAAKWPARTISSSSFEKGYDEEVGEGGNLLSVGQKQLISLARAVLANPEIFIMDEATSSVDTLTEALIQRGMEILMKGRTSFVIAHRLSTIKRADRILVIEDGRIAEMGTHAELLRQRGHYYRLYTQQFRQEREAEYDPFQNQKMAQT